MIPEKQTPKAVARIVLKIDVHLILVYITTLSTKGGVLPRRVMAPVVIMDISPWLLTKCSLRMIKNFYTNDDDEKDVESDDHEAPEDGGNSKVTEPFRVLAPFLDGVHYAEKCSCVC